MRIFALLLCSLLIALVVGVGAGYVIGHTDGRLYMSGQANMKGTK